jgi:hypothetical protein
MTFGGATMACEASMAEMETEWQCADETRSIRANALPIKVDVVDVVDAVDVDGGGARAEVVVVDVVDGGARAALDAP